MMAAIYREARRQGADHDKAARLATGKELVRTTSLVIPGQDGAQVAQIADLVDREVRRRKQAGLPTGLRPRWT
jgi:hypothetical protein